MNIIVIVTDSLRSDHVGCYPNCLEYSGRKVETPNMDRLAADGTLFLNAYSESLPTMPTRTTWWTGRVGFPFRGWQTFEHNDYLLAEVLWDKGYTSALITDTYHMHKPTYNCGRGFDSVVWVRGQEYDPWKVEDIAVDAERWHRLKGDDSDNLWGPRFQQYLKNRAHFKTEEDWFAPRVAGEAIRWLDHTVKGKGLRDDLFLWVDFFDPHEPWDPPEPYWSMYRDPEYRGQDIIDPVAGPTADYLAEDEVHRVKTLYAGSVTYVDKWAGQVIEHVRQLGLYEDSLIVWLSDHGEPFGEHGIIRKARPWNYEELVHIPWIMKPPLEMKEKYSLKPTIDALVQPTDVMPTLLEVAGVSTPLELAVHGPRRAGSFPQDRRKDEGRIRVHGASALPLLRGDMDRIREFVFTGHHRQTWSIQNQDWRYLLFLSEKRAPELYNRKEDREDKNNVIEQQRAEADALELVLRRWAAGLK